MDPTRAGAVLARHAGIDEETGQLTADEDGGPRSLVISSDFYKVYESAGKKADGLVNLFCWAHVRDGILSGPGTRALAAEVLDGRVAGADPGPLRRARRADGRLAGRRRARPAGKEAAAAPGWRRRTRRGTTRSP